MRNHSILILILLVVLTLTFGATAQEPPKKDKPAAPLRQLFTGKVVNLKDALKKRGIKATDEFKNQVVLETPKGELIPIVPDWRGRAFYQDKRLRNRKVDLVGYRKPGIPYLQVLMVFTYIDKGERLYTDYWCDICSIPMYEIKPCDCCQDKTRLRFQPQPLPAYLAQPHNQKHTNPKGTGKTKGTSASGKKQP